MKRQLQDQIVNFLIWFMIGFSFTNAYILKGLLAKSVWMTIGMIFLVGDFFRSRQP